MSSSREKVSKLALSGKQRARMGTDKTPENSKPIHRKRKPSTRARTLKDMLNVMDVHQSSDVSTQLLKSPEDKKRKLDDSLNSSELMPQDVGKQEAVKESSETEDTQVTTTKDKDTKENNTSQDNSFVVASKPSNVTSDNTKVPSSRWGHTLCMLNEGEAVLIGGQGDKQTFNKDAVWHLDIGHGSWKPLTTRTTEGHNTKPETRMGHTAVYDPTVRAVYLFGGSKNLKWFSDVHMLDIDEWKWQIVKTNGKAPTRAYHSATLYRHELWIYGGVFPQPDPQPDGCSNEIHVFSPMEESWYSPIVMGDKPTPRSGHSANLLDDKMVMFGGWDAPVCFNDLHILDLCTVDWSRPKTNGTPPAPRSWHASSALTGNRVLIHGGYNGDIALHDSFIFNLDNLSWTCVKLEPPIAARVGHTSLCLPYRYSNKEQDEVLIFGGGDNDGNFFKDLVCVMVPFETPNVL